MHTKTHHKAGSMHNTYIDPVYSGLKSKHCEIPEILPAKYELEKQNEDATLWYISSMKFLLH